MRALPLLAVLATGCFLTPSPPLETEVLDGPFDSLSESQLAVFLRGDEQFARQFRKADGLGPIFNAGACATCHPGDGPGHPEFGLTRFGRTTLAGFDPMIDQGGPQLQNRAVLGATPESLPDDATITTLLLAPAVTGLGLLEAVDDEVLLATADENDTNGDGISGRVHWRAATDELRAIAAEAESNGSRIVEHPQGFIGRFGRRGSNISLMHQAVSAYHQDMGITSIFALTDLSSGDGARDQASDPEVGLGELADVVFYLRTLRPPVRRDIDDPDVMAGEQLFAEIDCATCHTPTMKTGASSVDVLDEVSFHPYTDLLLHEMGSELADGYAENGSRVGEWRTPPLWGIGLAAQFTGGELFLMHDGRANTLVEAIELHAGEASQSLGAWKALDTGEQAQVIRFLESL